MWTSVSAEDGASMFPNPSAPKILAIPSKQACASSLTGASPCLYDMLRADQAEFKGKSIIIREHLTKLGCIQYSNVSRTFNHEIED